MNREQILALVDDCPSCITGDFSDCDVSEKTKAKVLAYLAEHPTVEYTFIEQIAETRIYKVSLPSNVVPTNQEIRKLAYSQPYKVDYTEVQSTEIKNPEGDNCYLAD